MKKNWVYTIAAFLSVLVLSCAVGIQGAKKMEKSMLPVTSVEIGFNERIVSIFPVSLEHSFGMIAGKMDHESLRIVEIRNHRLHFDIFPRKRFGPATEKGLCAKGCSEMLMCGNRILRWVNVNNKTEDIVYWGMGMVTQNTYQKMKLLDEENKIILTVFSPYYDSAFDRIINNTSVITHEDLIEKK